MHALSVIRAACVDALEKISDGEEHWLQEYCSICGPTVVREMPEHIEALEQMQHALSVEELRALGDLVRDLVACIGTLGNAGPDPARRDLLKRAQMLLGLAWI